MRADYNIRLLLPAIPIARACFQLPVVSFHLIRLNFNKLNVCVQ